MSIWTGGRPASSASLITCAVCRVRAFFHPEILQMRKSWERFLLLMVLKGFSGIVWCAAFLFLRRCVHCALFVALSASDPLSLLLHLSPPLLLHRFDEVPLTFSFLFCFFSRPVSPFSAELIELNRCLLSSFQNKKNTDGSSLFVKSINMNIFIILIIFRQIQQ